jgi:hypothetical protein
MRHSLRTGREELTALRFAILGGDFRTAAAAGNLNASDCLPVRDFHSFAGKHRIGEPFLTQFFDALKKLGVVVRVVMREGQALHAGHFRKLHGLIEAERKTLDVVPVKVGKRDNDLFLLVADGAEVSAQISQSCSRVNDGDAVRIGEGDLQASGVAAELLKTSIADGGWIPACHKT